MWRAFAEQLQENGRRSPGFFLLGFLGAPLCAVMVSFVGPWTAHLLWIIWAILFAHGFARFIHDWRHPVRLGKLPPLSRHDLRIARSKLRNHQHRPSGLVR